MQSGLGLGSEHYAFSPSFINSLKFIILISLSFAYSSSKQIIVSNWAPHLYAQKAIQQYSCCLQKQWTSRFVYEYDK